MPLPRVPALLLFGAMSPAALAQSEPDPASNQAVRYQEVTELDLTGVEVNATLDGPKISVVVERRRAVVAPWIELRTDFDEEMRASVDAIR